jgi:hypothetical protein
VPETPAYCLESTGADCVFPVPEEPRSGVPGSSPAAL